LEHQKPKLRDWSILLLLTLIWGFSYYFIKHSLKGFSPWQIGSLRMVISSLVLLPFLARALRAVPAEKYVLITWVGLLGSFLPAILYPLAQLRISSSVAGIVNAFTPICTYLIGMLCFNVRAEKTKIYGTAIGLLGAVVLILFKPGAELRAELAFLLIAFVVPFLYGINSNTIKAKLAGIPGMELTTLMYFSTLLMSLPLGFMTGAFVQIPIAIAKGSAFYHLLALSVLGSALAMTLFNILIQRVHVLFASSVTYLMPLVALIVGWLDGESIRWNDMFGFSCILAGVAIANDVFRQKRNET